MLSIGERDRANTAPARTCEPRRFASVHMSTFALSLAIFGIAALHVLPEPTLMASTGARVAYDPTLNFLSEYVRTQYGALMTANFVLLAIAGGALGCALDAVGLRREARFMWSAGGVLMLLALLPTDLADFRTDLSTCHDPARIDPCTWVGRIHDFLPNFAFGFIALVVGSLSRRVDWRPVAKKGAWCAAIAVALALASHFYVALKHPHVERIWVGLMQRSVVGAALLWMAMLLAELRRRSIHVRCRKCSSQARY